MKLTLAFFSCAAIFLSASSQLSAAIALTVPAGATLNQNHNGLLGMDFDVTGPDGIIVTRLGAFDSGQDGILGTIKVGIVDRATGLVVGETLSFSGDAGDVVDGSRFLALTTPLVLPNGFQGSITAQGYGQEGNGNGQVSTIDDGDGLITFVGGGRWGGDDPLTLAPNADGGPANRYFAGTFEFLSEDLNEDLDGDGLPDAWEETFGLNPSDPDDADDDGDGDGLINTEEFENNTDPTERDTDGDDLADGEEVSTTMTDPTKRDSDGDGLWDSVETNTRSFTSWTGDLQDPDVPQTGDTGSDPNDSNTDDDGFADGAEVAAGFDPNDPNSGPSLSFQGMLAIDYLEPGVGTQNFTEGLGHDFLVIGEAIEVTALGVFDSGADGLNRELTSELWVRDDNNLGTSLLASLSFVPGAPGLLHHSNRIKSLPTPLVLEPGAYTIVGRGYGADEPNGNTAGPGPDLKPINDGGGRIEFVGGARYGGGGIGGAVGFPQNVDGGPPVRYAAGTFAFRTEPPPKLFWRISSSGNDLIFEWESRLGKVYDILSNDDLSDNPAAGWPLFRGDIAGTPPLNVETSLRPPDEKRYFVLVERDGPPLFEDDFETDKGWTAIVNDANGNTNWERGTPGGSTGPLTGADGSANAWSTNQGDYGPDSDIALRSPVIDLTGIPTAELSLDAFRDADGFADTASVRFLDATGLTQLGFEHPIDMTVFDGDWTNLVIPVAPEALGESVIIEINFISDNSEDTFSGLSIDNVSVSAE